MRKTTSFEKERAKEDLLTHRRSHYDLLHRLQVRERTRSVGQGKGRCEVHHNGHPPDLEDIRMDGRSCRDVGSRPGRRFPGGASLWARSSQS